MTAPVPDIKSLQKWEDAFQHPVPQVRQLERQLRNELTTNREKLRGLVGESYRDLLKTAERIIEMDASAQKVEAHLAETSRNCNSKLLDRKTKNLRTFQEKAGARDREKYVFATQLAVLQTCPPVISRILHQSDSSLLAAKVFVISRLLLTSLLQKGSLPLLGSLETQLGALRTFLLHHIDVLLSSPSLSISSLVTALTSFSLLKSSSPTEDLRHFLSIRSRALSSMLTESPAPSSEGILKAASLFNQTLAEAETIFPKRISDALLALKSKSLFQDTELTSVSELGLDVNGRWLPEEIRDFIPWLQHDDLEKSKVSELVKTWASRELETLYRSFGAALEGIEEIQGLVKLRADILSLWRAGRKSRARVLDQGGEKFREIVNRRLARLLDAKAAGLKGLGIRIGELVHTFEEKNRNYSTSLWADSLLSMDLSNGGFIFKEAVQDRVHGRDSVVKLFRKEYDQWVQTIAEHAIVIRDLRKSSPASEDEDDDFEVEEEKAQEGLEDSELAEKELAAALESCFGKFERGLSEFVDSHEVVDEEEEDNNEELISLQAIFVLRIIRQIRQSPPKRGDDVLVPLNWFGVGLAPKLHLIIARGIGRKSINAMKNLLKKRKWESKVAAKPLWEGTPPLPVQPSPLVFKFLHDLVTAMSSAGDDIWTPAAVRCIKGLAARALWKTLRGELEGRAVGDPEAKTDTPAAAISNGNGDSDYFSAAHTAENGDGENSDREKVNGSGVRGEDNNSETKFPVSPRKLRPQTPATSPRGYISRDWAVQLLFDMLYLDEALQRKGGNGGNNGVVSLAGKVESIVGKQLDLEEELRRRLEGSARECWKRACLLFALLA
ncbi:hypothetical protein RUND412_002728 [Rhizina undulata]